MAIAPPDQIIGTMKLEGKSFGCGLACGLLIALVAAGIALLIAAFVMQRARNSHPTATGDSTDAAGPTIGDERVARLLAPIRRKHAVPAIAAALVTSKEIIAVGATGVRKRGTDVAVTLDDSWHLGSDGKAMTATLLAKLVEQNRVNWNTTVADIFPEEALKFHADAKGITILQLLSHHAGLPANADWSQFSGADASRERLRVVQQELARRPKNKPGRAYEYSNLGYVIAGAIIEKITGRTWEETIREELFEPLEMKSAGFGGLGTPGKIDEPWPHTSDGKPFSQNGPAIDNLPVLGPAGRIHCTIQDWSKFVQDQLRGDRGEPALLGAASYQKLHTPPFDGEYALGWIVVQRSWAGGTALNHGGDNTMNKATVWIAPRRGFAVLVCVNQGGDAAFAASDDAVGALIGLHDKEGQAK